MKRSLVDFLKSRTRTAAGTILKCLELVFALCVASTSALAAAGTLTVHISAAPTAGGGHWFGAGRHSVWVYVWTYGASSPEKHLIGVRQVGTGLPAAVPDLTYTLPEGRYAADVLVDQDQRSNGWPPFKYLPEPPWGSGLCDAPLKFAITPAAQTRIAFPTAACDTLIDDIPTAATAQSVDSQYYSHVAMELKKTLANLEAQCSRIAAPLDEVYRQVRSRPPTTPLVFIPGSPILGGLPGQVHHAYASRDYDATQIRLLVKALKYACWEKPFRDLNDPGNLTPDQATIKERIRGIFENEARKLDRLNGIADILDDVARRQSRR